MVERIPLSGIKRSETAGARLASTMENYWHEHAPSDDAAAAAASSTTNEDDQQYCSYVLSPVSGNPPPPPPSYSAVSDALNLGGWEQASLIVQIDNPQTTPQLPVVRHVQHVRKTYSWLV